MSGSQGVKDDNARERVKLGMGYADMRASRAFMYLPRACGAYQSSEGVSEMVKYTFLLVQSQGFELYLSFGSITLGVSLLFQAVHHLPFLIEYSFFLQECSFILYSSAAGILRSFCNLGNEHNSSSGRRSLGIILQQFRPPRSYRRRHICRR